MSKAEKIINQNQTIMEEFIKQATNSHYYQLNFRSGLKLFLDLWNGDKPDKIKWKFEKSIFDVTMQDVIDYQKYLNQASIWSIVTKRTRFTQLRKFIKYILKKYKDNFKPLERLEFKADLNDKDSYKWEKKGHKEPNTYYKRLIMTKDEILKILTHLYDNDYQKYLIFRTLAETGMRKGELISIDIERNVEGRIIPLEHDLKNRCVRVVGKMDKLKYPISESLAQQLLAYLHTSRLTQQKEVKTKAFFVSQKGTRFNHTSLNSALSGVKNKDGTIKRKGILREVGIEKHITPHTFRRTLNTLRYEMGCSVEDREVLLNHKSGKINIDYYTIHKDAKIIELYDKWNPLKKLLKGLI